MLKASCHCGRVVLEVARRPERLTQCNCSICRRYGALWAYYTRATARVVKGRSALVIYLRRKHGTLEFYHCRFCGCVTHHERVRKSIDSTVGVNARNLQPRSVAETKIRILDGASTWKTLDESVQPDLFRSPGRRG